MRDLKIVPDSSWFQVWEESRHIATFYNQEDALAFVDGFVLVEMVKRYLKSDKEGGSR